MEIMEEIRTSKGNEAAADFLQEQFAKKKDRQAEFQVLFSKVWNVAQFETGHADPVWGSMLNDAAFCSAYRAGYYAEAFSIMNNLCARLGTARRFGRLAEVHGIMETTYRSGGVNMDIRSYPDLGPALKGMPEIRHRKMPSKFTFPETFPGGPPPLTRPENFGTKEAGPFFGYGWQKTMRGDWRNGLEWIVWLRDWASDENGGPVQARNEVWHDATRMLAEMLAAWGYKDEAMAMINEAVAAPYGRNYRGRAKITFAVRQLDQMREIGKPDPEMIPKLRELCTTIENHIHLGKGDLWRAKIALAKACFHEGMQQEGERILEEAIAGDSLDARHERVYHWIKTGRIEGVESELIDLLRASRANGHKTSEINLYNMYADFLEKNGRLQEALAMRREAIRLCRDFDMVHRLPYHLAKLAILLQMIGDEEGSRKAGDEVLSLLPDGDHRNSFHAQAREMLNGLKPSGNAVSREKTQQPEIDLQPRRSLVIPIEGLPWTSHLALSNPGTAREQGSLHVTGAAAEISVVQETGDVMIQLADGGADGGKSTDLTLDPSTYRLVEISGSGPFEARRELALRWISASKQNTVESVVQIETSETGVAGAIIQAGVYQANPFYGVPIHLTYATKTPAQTSPPVRFITSQPARVEIYQLDGTPLAIDGQGNGSLLNTGDELFGKSDGSGNPVLPLADGRSFFRAVVYPEAPIAKEGLQLDIEVFSDGKWSLHSRNRIEP